MALNLSTASKNQGLEVIPAGTLVTLVIKIRAGTIGVEALCKRSSKGDSEGVDIEYTVKGGEFDGRKLKAFQLLDGTTAGHAKAAGITRALLRAIFEAVNAIDPKDESPEADARRNSATLVGFNGSTFLATLEVEPGGQRPDGIGRYRDKNVIGKILRVGDKDYRRLDQPPPMPYQRPPPPPPQPPPRRPAALRAPMVPTRWRRPRSPGRIGDKVNGPATQNRHSDYAEDRRYLAAAGNRRRHHRNATGHRRRRDSEGDSDRAAHRYRTGLVNRGGVIWMDSHSCRTGHRRGLGH